MLPRRLMQGYASFKSQRLSLEKNRYRILSSAGQRPETMIIGCCDSRAAPETIFDASPGELFVVRNVANLVPPMPPSPTSGTSHGLFAALEFGVQSLRLRHIVVLGHGRCGGIKGFLELRKKGPLPAQPTSFLEGWIRHVDPAAEELRAQRVLAQERHAHEKLEEVVIEVTINGDRPGLLADMTAAIAKAKGNVTSAAVGPTSNRFVVRLQEGWQQVQEISAHLAVVPGIGQASFLLPDHESQDDRNRDLELKMVEHSLRNLRTYPLIKDLETINEVSLHGAWFDISTGQLLVYDETHKSWGEQ